MITDRTECPVSGEKTKMWRSINLYQCMISLANLILRRIDGLIELKVTKIVMALMPKIIYKPASDPNNQFKHVNFKWNVDMTHHGGCDSQEMNWSSGNGIKMRESWKFTAMMKIHAI